MSDKVNEKITAKWWNSKDINERLMMALHDTETRIQQIRIDQTKAKTAHQKFMRETNKQIKNCERFIENNIGKINYEPK